MKKEQVAAGLTPKQATPLFVDKLYPLSTHLHGEMKVHKTDLRCIFWTETRLILKHCYFSVIDLETSERFVQTKKKFSK